MDDISGLFEPGGFGGAHLPALGVGVIFGAGEMVETVGDVHGELVVDAVVVRTDLDGTVNVNDEVAAPCLVFAGDRLVPEADNVGGPVFPKVFAIGLEDGIIVDQDDTDLAPAVGRGGVFEPDGEPISQLF